MDRLPRNALVIAKIEKKAGIKASYYFRIVKQSYDEDIIRQIADMGHEIGYHYENLSDPQINADYLISHRPTPVPSSGATGQARTDPSTIFRTYGAGTNVLAERPARIKMVIASRKKSQKESSPRLKTEISRLRKATPCQGGQMSEVRRARARDRDPQITPVRFSEPTGQARTDTDIYPADFAGQKKSSPRLNKCKNGFNWVNLAKKEKFRDTLFELALEDFGRNLEKFRELYPVKTICMHGSPLSKWDNRDLWKRYDCRDYGIIAEPYFDLDFREVLYLTDTGRRWDGDRVSVRDKVKKTGVRDQGSGIILRENEKVRRLEGKKIKDKRQGTKVWGLRFRHTWDIIAAAERGLLPDKKTTGSHLKY